MAATTARARSAGGPEAPEEEGRPHGQDDVADLTDRAVGEKPLGVALLHRLDRADEERYRADRGDRQTPGAGVERRVRGRGHEEERPHEPVDPGLEHDAAQQGAHGRRGDRVGVGQPELAEGKDAGLQAETGEEEGEEAEERQAVRRAELGGGRGQGLAELVAVDEESPADDEEPRRAP